jgi:hypothetical protein
MTAGQAIDPRQQALGRCLCDTVTFRVIGGFDSFFLCHCTRCRRSSGSAHAANLFAFGAELIWMSGEEHTKLFTLADTQHAKCFCTTCGSALPYHNAKDNMVVVPAGALDTPVTIRPKAHICYAMRANWDDDLTSVRIINGLPG